METNKMQKAKEILYKHAGNNGCKYVLSRNPFLEKAVLNAINEALVGPSEQFYCDKRDKYGNTDCTQQCMACVIDEHNKYGGSE